MIETQLRQDLARLKTALQDSETQRNVLEETVREVEERLNFILNSLKDYAVMVLDTAGRVVSWNSGAERMLGYSASEIIGQDFHQFFLPEDRDSGTPDRELQGAKTEGRASDDRWHVRKDGSRFWASGYVRPILDGNNVKGYVKIMRELTETKQAEDEIRRLNMELEKRVEERTQELQAANNKLRSEIEQRTRAEEALLQSRKLEAIGRLAGGIAHDFNNLMTGILGIAEGLRSELRENPLGAEVEEIVSASKKASLLIKQLLAFGRRQVIAPTLLNMNHVILEALKFYKRVLGENVTLKTSLDPTIGNIKIDQGQLEQVLHNLVLNARDAMPAGGVIEITTANVEVRDDFAKTHLEMKRGPYATLTVADTGHGMGAETLQHLFEPFYTTKPAGAGTGLGLATVYGIVKQNHGEILVDTKPGAGTTFHLYFPRLEEPARVDRRGPNRTPEGPGGNETILVVEDEDIVRHVTARALAKRGYTVLQAHHPDQAMALAHQHAAPIDLLLTDVVMPGNNGRQLATRLKAERPEMKVLYMSGQPQDIILEQGALEPDIDFIQKSFTTEGLCHKVRAVLDRPASSPGGAEATARYSGQLPHR